MIGKSLGLDCVSAVVLPPLMIGLVYCQFIDKKKRAVKNGSPKKHNYWAVSPQYRRDSTNKAVQTLGLILHEAGILSRFSGEKVFYGRLPAHIKRLRKQL
jgi:hypothetical protein